MTANKGPAVSFSEARDWYINRVKTSQSLNEPVSELRRGYKLAIARIEQTQDFVDMDLMLQWSALAYVRAKVSGTDRARTMTSLVSVVLHDAAREIDLLVLGPKANASEATIKNIQAARQEIVARRSHGAPTAS
jgi:hypothetical protein